MILNLDNTSGIDQAFLSESHYAAPPFCLSFLGAGINLVMPDSMGTVLVHVIGAQMVNALLYF